MHYNGLNACALMECRYVHILLLDFAYTFTTGSATYTSLLIVMDTLAVFIYTLGYWHDSEKLVPHFELYCSNNPIITDKARPII